MQRKTNKNMCKNYIFLVFVAMMAASCATHQQFYKADIIGIGTDAQTSYAYHKGPLKNVRDQSAPIDLLNDSPSFRKALDAVVPRGNNTTLYYATDLACDRIRWVRRKIAKYDRETKYYIFLLTDGLDNASVKMAKNARQARVTSPEAYRDRIVRKLKQATGTFKDYNDLTVYVMLRKGKDIKQIAIDNELSDEAFEAYLDRQFECFRYATRGDVPDLIQEEEFAQISKKMEGRLVNNTLEFRVPKDFRGKRIRMTMTDQNKQEAVLEGTLKNVAGRYRLVNVSETGLVKDSLRTDKTRQKGRVLVARKADKRDANVFFTISGLKESDGVTMYSVKTVKQAVYDGQLWQNNTEYEQRPAIRANAYCIFLIDGSLSLTDRDVKAEKDCVKKIIQLISPATNL